MFALVTPLLASALLSSTANAHGIVTKIVAGTKTYSGYSPDFQYMPTPPAVIGWTAPMTQDRGFVLADKLADPDVICHKGATNAAISAEVAAGDKVSLQWTAWPDSHHGPVMDYLADCGADCSKVDKTQLKFFKIDGVGMTDVSSTPPKFADDDMIKADNTWTVTIPSSVKAGNYVLRHETIALHEAGTEGKAQLYPQCINLKITGGGTDSPAGVLGTQLYKSTDPGIKFNIYQKFTSTDAYIVPGPPVMGGAAGPAAPAAAPPAAPAPKSNVAAPPAAGSICAPASNRKHARAF